MHVPDVQSKDSGQTLSGSEGERMVRTKRFAWIAFMTVVLTGIALAQSVLDNAAVVKMVKAGLGDDTIVSMINTQPGNYTVTPDAMIQLKQAGVSEKVIDAMIAKASGVPPPAAAPAAAPAALPVDEVGVYFKGKDGKWVEMLPEIVNFKTGGFLKTLGSDGIVKGDVNGHIAGKSAKIAMETPLDFLIYMQEGVEITEYQLLRLHVTNDGREFRSVTGGVVHSSGGAQRDEVDFQGTKIAPHMYEILLGPDVKGGEFGFLPPGATSSSNMASGGKMYTFSVTE
jgi:hypothetical protein